jgi:hypothetical protein
MAMKSSTLLLGALSVACTTQVAPLENEISPLSYAGYDLSQARHALYIEGQNDYDSNNDGELDSTIKYIQFMISDHPDLCREMQDGTYIAQLRLGYATAAFFGPIGQELPDLRAEDVLVGDYYEGIWVDHGLTIIKDFRYKVDAAGYGDGSLRIDRINDIGEPFSAPDLINDIGEPSRYRTLRNQDIPDSVFTDPINDIGEPLLPAQINDIGEPLRGIAQGEMHYDMSGAKPFDLDFEGDGISDATEIPTTPIMLTIRSAQRCNLGTVEGDK